MTELSKAQALSKADAAAYSHLRKKYGDEFATVKQQEAQKLGVDWKPRPSKADRDRAELLRILNDNPALKNELKTQLSESEAFQNAH